MVKIGVRVYTTLTAMQSLGNLCIHVRFFSIILSCVPIHLTYIYFISCTLPFCSHFLVVRCTGSEVWSVCIEWHFSKQTHNGLCPVLLGVCPVQGKGRPHPPLHP